MCGPGPGLLLAGSRVRWMLLQTVCLTSDSGSRVNLSCLLFPCGACHAGSCAQGLDGWVGSPLSCWPSSALGSFLCFSWAQHVWNSRGCPKANSVFFVFSAAIRPVLLLSASLLLYPHACSHKRKHLQLSDPQIQKPDMHRQRGLGLKGGWKG